MPLKQAIKLLEKASDEDKRENYYKLWLVRYTKYTASNYETFDEFYEKIFPPAIEYDERSKDDLMAEILGI